MALAFKTRGLVLQLCSTFNTFEARRMPFPFNGTEIELVRDTNPASCAQRWLTVTTFTGFNLKNGLVS